jgi:hypothetical protein
MEGGRLRRSVTRVRRRDQSGWCWVQVLHVVVTCWVRTVSGLPGLEMLFGVHLLVAEHGLAVDAIVGDVVAMHGAVEPMGSRHGLWGVCAGVGSCGLNRRFCGSPLVQLSGHAWP